MGNKRRVARMKFHQTKLAQEAAEDEKKAQNAEKRSVRTDTQTSTMWKGVGSRRAKTCLRGVGVILSMIISSIK